MDRVWEVLGEVFVLNSEAFQAAATLSGGMTLAIWVVLLSGLSLAVGQSIILFINQVQPVRFILSLLINAILYLFEFLFLVLSTWLVCLLPGSVQVSLTTLIIVLGLSYAPLLFSFLGALPYFGLPLLRALSIWHLLAMVVGFGAIANVGAGFAFGYVAIGWFTQQLLGNTIGQPIAQLGKAIADRTAGVDLARDRQTLVERVQSRFGIVSTPIIPAAPVSPASATPNPGMNWGQGGDRATTAPRSAPAPGLTPPATVVPAAPPTRDPIAKLAFQASSIPQAVKVVCGLLAFSVLFILVFILLRPVRDGIFGWYETLPRLARLVFDLSWIGVIGLIFAGLLAPFETLGWWAGWFGDAVDPHEAIAPRPAPGRATDPALPAISRYIVYLDGVGQSGEAHTPDVEAFLDALQPVLPHDMQLVRGLMMYSVLNKPLNEDRPLTFLWNLADKIRWQNPTALLGLLVNVRNAIIVMVSADKRYGPIYNRGIAQVLYNGLIEQGYQPGSGIPITLVGYSGGAQMSVAAAPHLKRALGAPIDVISLGGVMSANHNFLQLEHLYHLVGEKDGVEKFGPLLFAGRWKLLPLSYWNRAKRKGKVSLLSVGPVGHQVPGGYMDPCTDLPDGRSCLQQTIDWILAIVTGNLPETVQLLPVQQSHYAIYKQAPFNDAAYYPIDQSVDENWYPAIAPWMGRLLLPPRDQRHIVRGVLLEVHHAATGYEHLVGQTVILRWADTPFTQNLLQAARRDVYFSANAEYSSRYGGLVHPERVNRWQQVGPLESLAGARPTDDMVVMLNEPVAVELNSRWSDTSPGSSAAILRIQSQPVQITGRYYALVQFVAAIAGTDQFRVVHFNRATRQFDGLEDVVRLPAVVDLPEKGSSPSTTRNLEKSDFNETGWYIYGAKDAAGMFVVQALGPRALFRLQPDEVVFGKKPSYRYIRQRAWADPVGQKGRIASVLCVGRDDRTSESIQTAIQGWQEGDRALLVHVYGGIGGNKAEPAATTPIYFGHFSFGIAQVIYEPLCDELRFDLRYHQVYTHNSDGLIAGTIHWSRYMGDRQFGWLGNRPVCDVLIKQESFTDAYDFSLGQRSALDYMVSQLEVMTARYRIGDGTGGTYVGAASNCAQDSNQALFASLRQIERQIAAHSEALDRWREQHPEQTERLAALLSLKKALRQKLQPLGGPKSSWERNEYHLGTTMEDGLLRNLRTGLGSWRTLLPRLASDTVVKVFLDHGASVWVLRTNQIGGYDPDIEPVAPMTL